jgi:hypothetical protein
VGTPRRSIPAERKLAYYAGLGLTGLGLVVFVSCFFMEKRLDDGGPPAFMIRALVGMGLLVAGGVLRAIGARGLAGSGMVLDPERARDDLEPYARMAGGLVRDAAEESGLVRARPHLKLQCPACARLNEADARFCQGCGRAF